MISYQRSNNVLLILSLLLISCSGYAVDNRHAVLTVKGVASKGSCAFLLSEQVVKFSQPFLTESIGEIGAIEENKMPFSISYLCQDYDENDSPDMSITIKAAAGTDIKNNKIAPVNNLTNAAFVLYDCNNVNACSLINFTSDLGTIYFKSENGRKDKNFQVEVVKLNALPVQSGDLQAIVTLTLIQP